MLMPSIMSATYITMAIESISVSLSPDTSKDAVTPRITNNRMIRIVTINHAEKRIFD